MHRLHYAEWGAREWIAAIDAVVAARVHRGPHLAIVGAHLNDIVGNRPIHLVNAGRNAIRLALDAFRKARPRLDRVVVPGYICPSVVDAVLACGLVPVGADIGADLNVRPDSVLEAIDDRTLAVICPHMYGCPAPIATIEHICRDAGVFLIDDSAQVLGVRVDGRPLGTLAMPVSSASTNRRQWSPDIAAREASCWSTTRRSGKASSRSTRFSRPQPTGSALSRTSYGTISWARTPGTLDTISTAWRRDCIRRRPQRLLPSRDNGELLGGDRRATARPP